MTIYVIQVGILLVMLTISQASESIETKKRCYYFGVFVLFIVLFLRKYNVGSDLGRYHTLYDMYGRMTIREIVETNQIINLGYCLYNHIVYSISRGNYQFFIALTSLITIIPVTRLIIKSVGYSNYSLLVYVCFGYYAFQFSGLKQAIAMAVLSKAYLCIVEHRKYPFYIYVLFAALFHVPSLVFLPAYYIAHHEFDTTSKAISVIIVVIAYLLRGRIVGLLLDNYESVVDLYGTVRAGGKVLLILAIVIYGYLFCLPEEFRIDETRILWRFMIVSAIIQSFANYGNVFERLADYYFFYIILYLPRLVTVHLYDTEESSIKTRIFLEAGNQLLAGTIITIAVVAFYWLYYRIIPGLIPYSIWISFDLL